MYLFFVKLYIIRKKEENTAINVQSVIRYNGPKVNNTEEANKFTILQ